MILTRSAQKALEFFFLLASSGTQSRQSWVECVRVCWRGLVEDGVSTYFACRRCAGAFQLPLAFGSRARIVCEAWCARGVGRAEGRYRPNDQICTFLHLSLAKICSMCAHGEALHFFSMQTDVEASTRNFSCRRRKKAVWT